MSDVRYYRDLLLQRERIEAFRAAIGRAVRPGSAVLDVGTGLGTFAFFAADAGAEVVWAVDGAPVVHLARTIGRLNGYGERVQFIRGWLPDVLLPGRADVVIFEDFSPRLADARFAQILAAIQDRYAVRSAAYVPAGARFYAAPVVAAGADEWGFGSGEETRMYGIDWGAMREYLANAPAVAEVEPGRLLAQPSCLAEISFAAPLACDALAGRAEWRVERAGNVSALAYWFDLDMGRGAWLSNAPGAGGSWGHLVLPVVPPLRVEAGSRLTGMVGPEPQGDGLPGWLRWSLASGIEEREGHEFAAQPAGSSDVLGASPDAVPRLNAWGTRVAEILALVDGSRSMRQIAAALCGPQGGQPGLSPERALRLVIGALRDKIELGRWPP